MRLSTSEIVTNWNQKKFDNAYNIAIQEETKCTDIKMNQRKSD